MYVCMYVCIKYFILILFDSGDEKGKKKEAEPKKKDQLIEANNAKIEVRHTYIHTHIHTCIHTHTHIHSFIHTFMHTNKTH